MGKGILSEEDIKLRYITPAILGAGWDRDKQVRMEYTFTAGRIILRGNITARGRKKSADYLLSYKRNFPLAIVEAKDNKHSVGAGLQQAIEYAKALDVPYVYASNGDGFVEQNLISGEVRDLKLDEFPSPEDLYEKFKVDKGIDAVAEKVILEPYYYVPSYKTPRYYQRVAINRAVDAVAKGQNRVLLVSATGTGKTYMTFQIIYPLWKSGLKKKILFLADRNILIDQTISGDFKPFSGKLTKVQDRKLDSSYEIYTALYHQLSGDDGEEAFRQFQPNFFDLIVIDECHRGSAKEESAWRRILDYFSEATHIGCTATPIETKEASSYKYFGEPIYEYSLKQGIDDGFLAQVVTGINGPHDHVSVAVLSGDALHPEAGIAIGRADHGGGGAHGVFDDGPGPGELICNGGITEGGQVGMGDGVGFHGMAPADDLAGCDGMGQDPFAGEEERTFGIVAVQDIQDLDHMVGGSAVIEGDGHSSGRGWGDPFVDFRDGGGRDWIRGWRDRGQVGHAGVA